MLKKKKKAIYGIAAFLISPMFLISASCTLFKKEDASPLEKNKTELNKNKEKELKPLIDKANTTPKKPQKQLNKNKNTNSTPSLTPPKKTDQDGSNSHSKPQDQPMPPSSKDKKTKFKWGHWNVLHFNGKPNRKDKTNRIAILSEKEDFDVLGLTEVDDADAVKNIVDKMNELKNSNIYSYIASERKKGSIFNRSSAEYVAIIYNKEKFSPIEFNNGKKGYSYTEKFTDFQGNSNAEYARPPYGVQFKYNLKPNERMTFVFDHFDGPGKVKKDLGETKIHGMGSFEFREAKQLKNVLDRFNELSGNSGNIFFGGDTNIILNKEHLAFDWLKKYSNSGEYESILEDSDEYKTSLDTKGGYKNPYDKMFYKSKYKLTDFGKFDLYKVVTDSKYSELFKKHRVEITDKKKIRNSTVLSDHTYTWAEFEI